MKNIIGIIMLMFVFTSASAQGTAVNAAKKKINIVSFETSAICESCKKRIEKEKNYTKGIVYSELDMETKILTVKYKTKVLTEEKVMQLVSDIGYKAGDIEPNKEAYTNLPKCCQKPGLCKE